MNVVITIGNSDNKLIQKEWSRFCEDIDYFCWCYAKTIYFRGHSLPNSDKQNACWSMEIEGDNFNHIKLAFKSVAAKYNKDSIAWLQGTTELL